jgi:hypothetical protein
MIRTLRPIRRAPAMTSNLPADRRGRSGQPLCDAAHALLSGNAARNLFALAHR